MTNELERNLSSTQALKFLGSLRGRMILGQALGIAIAELEKIEGAHRQVSNIADMRDLLESDLPINLRDDYYEKRGELKCL